MPTSAPLAPHWRLDPAPRAAVEALERHGIPRLLATLLVKRGHTEPEGAAAHLAASPMGLHDPFLLPGMQAAAERIARAIRDRETILVHGDYDVDGVTGTALLMRLFALLGARAAWHIPNRLEHGYSFGTHSIERAEREAAKVVISVDNGTSAHAVIAALAERGIDTVVTDHHEAPPGPLPVATAIVNPKLPESRYPMRELCGGAVAFKLAWGLCQHLFGAKRASEEFKRFLEEATAYVAIATVCDVVPLLDENRIFARFGLKALETTRNAGLQALLDVAGLRGQRLTAEDVGFQIGPRLNASGRLGSAERAVECLLARDAATARAHAQALDELNRQRKEIEAAVLVEARAAAERCADPAEHPVLVLAGQGWHQGVVGIVAARLTEEYHRPAIVIGLDGDTGRGSARTVGRFDVLAAMSAAAPHLERFGGHAQAAGLELRAEQLDAVRAAIQARARELLAGAAQAGPELEIDCELPFEHMTRARMQELERLGPFGARNDAPVFLAREVYLAEAPRAIGSEKNHLLLRLRKGEHVLKALAFRAGARLSELSLGTPIDAVFTPKWNTFRGETSLELELLDFR
ncbi:MAG TPA: single-stranded-DNA-specific exonuclease RecJ [Planctomycetota bacterium]